MKDQEYPDNIGELKDLEDLEDLEELEELEEFPRDYGMDVLSKLKIPPEFSKLHLPEFWGTEKLPFQPLVILDKDMNLTWFNQPLIDLFGKRELMGVRYLSQLIKKPQGDEEYQEMLLALHRRDRNFSCNQHVDIHIPTKGTCHLLFIILPLLNNSLEVPNHYLGIVEDHTLRQRKLVFRTFKSLLEASMLKDHDTGNHVKRVNAYSRFIAEKIREDNKYILVNRNFIEDISYLAAMHDVGKIGTPDDILNKEGPLEDWEMRIMREHTTNGAFILSNYPNPMAKDIALNHHEHWDGKGYPYGKQGEMIPLCARIVAIADVYDALRSKRSYKDGWTHQHACDLMIRDSGTHFDPYIIDLFHINHKEMDKIWLKMQD